ncbi:MAG: hypothetical protein ACJ788_14070 [Ktedonobacteraceae bacterium]
MNNGNTVQFRTVLGGAILTLLWICCFLFIKPTLEIQFGGGINANFKLVVVLIGLLIIVLYHIFNRPNPATTKLSLTTALTLTWLALIVFYPFNPPSGLSSEQVAVWPGGAVGFFALIGGLGVVVLWVHFFSDEIV